MEERKKRVVIVCGVVCSCTAQTYSREPTHLPTNEKIKDTLDLILIYEPNLHEIFFF